VSGDPAVNADAELWRRLRLTTPARIGLGRTGNTLPLARVLELQAAHAVARDAVAVPLDPALLAATLDGPSVAVRSAAIDRSTYLQRPDLGRRLSVEGRARMVHDPCDVLFVLGDGLSARAAQAHAAPLVSATSRLLTGLSVGTTAIVQQARVAVGDEIGELVGARVVVVLIGERPGLSVSDSLGAYITSAPRVGRRDSERRCVSNIHPGGLGIGPAAAAVSSATEMALAEEVAGNRDVYLPDLAVSANNLAIRLGDLGRRAEALIAAQEAVALYQELCDIEPHQYRTDLERVLHLAAHLSDDELRG